MEWLTEPWANVVIGLIGVLAGYVFFRLSQDHPRLTYRIIDTELVETRSDPDDPIGILFEDQPVPRVNKSLLYLWNSGRNTAKGKDIVQSDPLRLSFAEDARVLRAQVLTQTRPTSNLSVEPRSHNEVLISFDYMEPGDGCVLEVLHTGDVSKRQLIGSIMGIPRGPKDDSSSDFVPRGIRPGAVFVMLAAAVLAVLLARTGSDAPTGEDAEVQQIVESLPESDREQLVNYVNDYGGLPEGAESDDSWLFYLICAGLFGAGLYYQAFAASPNRPPASLMPKKPRKKRRRRKLKSPADTSGTETGDLGR